MSDDDDQTVTPMFGRGLDEPLPDQPAEPWGSDEDMADEDRAMLDETLRIHVEESHNLRSMFEFDQYNKRLTQRMTRCLRLVELGAPEVILKNELDLVNSAALHFQALVYQATQPARDALEAAFQKRMDEMPDDDEDDWMPDGDG